MSFLSRIRKSVTPTSKTKVNNSSSNSSNDRKRSLQRPLYREKVDDGDQLHNYRKSTKSFNEKSLKPQNSYHSYGNSDEDEHRWRSTKSNHKLNDTKKVAAPHTTATGKSMKTSIHTPTLSRSDTFTLDEENEVQNGTYLRYKKKDNAEYGDGDDGRPNGGNTYNYTSNNNNDLKTDTSLTRNRGKKYSRK